MTEDLHELLELVLCSILGRGTLINTYNKTVTGSNLYIKIYISEI